MKKFIFSIGTLVLALTGFAQTPYPCPQYFDVTNNANGGQVCPTNHPDNSAYKKDGTFVIKFTNAVGTGVSAPDIITVQKMLNGNLETAADMKFFLKSLSADRTLAQYCFYSTNNANLFNGSGASYVFTIQYNGLTAQVCNPVTQGQTLPVRFGLFTATKTSRGASLKWETITEINNQGFYVERKQGSSEWNNIGFVPSKADNGNSDNSINYSFEDALNITTATQYRIRQVDIDGKTSYSEIRYVKGEGSTGITLYPNPSKGQLSVIFSDASSLHNVQVMDMQGRVVKSTSNVKSGQEITGLQRGQYVVMITNLKSNETVSEKFVVQ